MHYEFNLISWTDGLISGSPRAVLIADRYIGAGRPCPAIMARPVPNLGLIGVGAVRAARDTEQNPDGACGLAAGPGPVVGVVLTLPAMIGAVAAPIPIRIHEHLGALSRNERKDMHGRVGVVDTLPVLVHGAPDG